MPPLPPMGGTPGVQGVLLPGTPGAGPADVYTAFRAQRRELGRQLETLEGRRSQIARRLEQGADGANRTGLEARLVEVDKRIADVERQIAEADAQVARAASVPGATVEPRPPQPNGPPEQVFIVGVVFIVFVLFPLVVTWAVRSLRRTPRVTAPASPELAERLNRIEQAVDTVAVEVERIGEGQRFLSRIFADPGTARQLEALAAQAPEVAREPVTAVGGANR